MIVYGANIFQCRSPQYEAGYQMVALDSVLHTLTIKLPISHDFFHFEINDECHTRQKFQMEPNNQSDEKYNFRPLVTV